MRGKSTRMVLALAVALAGIAALAAAVLAQGGGAKAQELTVAMQNKDGQRVGTVKLRHRGGGPVEVRVSVAGILPPGFHGFHIHAVGKCEAPTFMSATGHLKQEGQEHGVHIGDMPSVLVKKDGRARARFETDSFGLSDLRDADGSAVMIHLGPDNYGNIPRDRYDPDPDRMTLDTGDTGARVACGLVQ